MLSSDCLTLISVDIRFLRAGGRSGPLFLKLGENKVMPQKQLEKNKQKEINAFSTVSREAEAYSVKPEPQLQEKKKEDGLTGGFELSVPKEARQKTVSNRLSYSKWDKLTEGIAAAKKDKKRTQTGEKSQEDDPSDNGISEVGADIAEEPLDEGRD